MYLFLLNKEIVISREKIIEEIWGYDFEGKDKIVDVYINLLRKKIENKNEKYIHTVRGFGYILKKIIAICIWNYDWEKTYANELKENGIAPNIETVPFPN